MLNQSNLSLTVQTPEYGAVKMPVVMLSPAPPTAPPPAQSRMSDIVNDKVIKIMSLVSKLTKSFSGMEKATQNSETEGQERFRVEPMGQ